MLDLWLCTFCISNAHCAHETVCCNKGCSKTPILQGFFTLLKKNFDPPPTFLLNIWYEILGLYEAFVRLLRILHFFNIGLIPPFDPFVQKTAKVVFWGIPKADVTWQILCTMQDQQKETSSPGLPRPFCQISKLEKLQRCHLSSNVGGCRWIQLIQPCNLQAGKTFFIIMQMHLRPTIFVYHPHTAIDRFYKETAQDLIIGININTDTPFYCIG